MVGMKESKVIGLSVGETFLSVYLSGKTKDGHGNVNRTTS